MWGEVGHNGLMPDIFCFYFLKQNKNIEAHDVGSLDIQNTQIIEQIIQKILPKYRRQGPTGKQ